MTEKIKIVGISDLHGKLSHQIPECDVLCIVGDIVPLYSSAEDWKQWNELRWLETKFLRWLKRQPFKQCIISWGNHDIVGYAPDTRALAVECLEKIEGVTVLQDAGDHIDIHGIRFSAYPYTPTIQQRNWAFSLPRGDNRVDLSIDSIPKNTDVLLSHGPPNGFLDLGEYGCAMLTKWVIEYAPRLVLCGHIHEERGKREKMWNSMGMRTRVINVSLCDENYTERGAKIQTCEILV